MSVHTLHPVPLIADPTDERFELTPLGDDGMSTAEYCVGLAVVVALAAVLLTIVQSHQIYVLMLKVVGGAFKLLN